MKIKIFDGTNWVELGGGSLENKYGILNFDANIYKFHMQDYPSSQPGYYNDTLRMYMSYNTCYMAMEDSTKSGASIHLLGGYNNNSHKHGVILCNYSMLTSGQVHNLHIYNTSTSGNKCNITCILRATNISSITTMANLISILYDAGHRGIASMLPANGLGYSTSACVIGIYASSRTASNITVVYTNTSSYATSTFTVSAFTVTDFRNGQFGSITSDI